MLRPSAFLYAATGGAAANRAQAIELCTFNARHQSGLSHYFLEAIAHPCATNLRVRLGLNLVCRDVLISTVSTDCLLRAALSMTGRFWPTD